MKGIKVYISEDIEEEFRKTAMKVFGYGKGSLSKAAEKAFENWILRYSNMIEDLEIPDDPVKAITGQLKGVEISAIELQHKVGRIRAGKFRNKGN